MLLEGVELIVGFQNHRVVYTHDNLFYILLARTT